MEITLDKKARPEMSAYECWMVKSNLESTCQGTPKADLVALLRRRGYYRIADAVEHADVKTVEGVAK